ncbi:MAG: hypothetical protein QUS11_06475 [Candidatus Fermentibacter sp.]|nr:hypothetical protein [Candidatus Fermentibacter sp.]
MIPRYQQDRADFERGAWGYAFVVCSAVSAFLFELSPLRMLPTVIAAIGAYSAWRYRLAGKVVRAYELQDRAEEAEKKAGNRGD